MPFTDITFFKDDDESVPLLDWLREQSEEVQVKCTSRITELQRQGYELRRPIADTLERGIHELRIKCKKVNYRILYAFHDKNAVLLSHGIIKESGVPKKEIDRAVDNLKKFKRNPEAHSHSEEL